MLDARFLSLFVHFPGVVTIESDWLFAQHMQPGLERQHRNWVVQVVGRADDERVELTPFDQLPVIGEHPRNAVFLCQLVGGHRVPPTDSCDRSPWMALEAGEMHEVRPCAGPNDPDTYLLKHCRSPFHVADATFAERL